MGQFYRFEVRAEPRYPLFPDAAEDELIVSRWDDLEQLDSSQLLALPELERVGAILARETELPPQELASVYELELQQRTPAQAREDEHTYVSYAASRYDLQWLYERAPQLRSLRFVFPVSAGIEGADRRAEQVAAPYLDAEIQRFYHIWAQPLGEAQGQEDPSVSGFSGLECVRSLSASEEVDDQWVSEESEDAGSQIAADKARQLAAEQLAEDGFVTICDSLRMLEGYRPRYDFAYALEEGSESRLVRLTLSGRFALGARLDEAERYLAEGLSAVAAAGWECGDPSWILSQDAA